MTDGLPIVGAADLIAQRKLSPVELTCEALARIAALNPTYDAVLKVLADSALAAAWTAEAEIAAAIPDRSTAFLAV